MDLIEWKVSLGTIIHAALTLGTIVVFGVRLTVIGVEIRARVNEIWREWRGTDQRDSFPVRMAKVEHAVADIENARRLGDWRGER